MIDFLSDTVTMPTSAMREAMAQASVGDDCYGEDPTVNRLESLAARMVGKEASVFVSSGTLGNLTSILAQCPRGHKVILGDKSDLYSYEAGGLSVIGGIVMHPVKTECDGRLAIDQLRSALGVRSDYQCAPASVLALEDPHCQTGGRVLPLSYLRDVRELANQHGLSVHLDGARLFNASVASRTEPREITKYADSVTFCLSKSLAAPCGSMVCGNLPFTDSVRRYRKMLGGGMRQSGFLAAAGIVALETMVDRLRNDHVQAARLTQMLGEIPAVSLVSKVAETNMVFFSIKSPRLTNEQFLEQLLQRGVRMGLLGDNQIRAVTHYMIRPEDVDLTVQIIKTIMQGYM